jgi:predicted dehydrogenase
MSTKRTRRQFLQHSLAVGGATVLTTGFWSERLPAKSKSPSELLNIGVIGSGGRGRASLESITGENIVALCDVDEVALGKSAEDYAADARTYVDFRKLLDEGKDLDAVCIATPEHTHAVAAVPAIRMGKHVYLEKPLAHSVWETRVIREEAAKHKVATQMGTQIHASDNYRRIVELVQSGAVGNVSECHVWVERDWGGGSRPTSEDPVPKTLHWDLWLGPAPRRPFSNAYVPGPKWYEFWDFGNGVMPDLGSHWNDLPFWALKLGIPTTIEAEGPPVSPETAPKWLICHWDFPARENLPAVKLHWYHGGKQPALLAEKKLPDWKNGVLFVGEGGRMLLADYQKYKLFPEDQFKDFKAPPKTIPDNPAGHWAEWITACKTGTPTLCNFDYSGNLTESNLLGNVAYRVGKKLEWDPVALRAKNCPEADKFLKPELHNGYTL